MPGQDTFSNALLLVVCDHLRRLACGLIHSDGLQPLTATALVHGAGLRLLRGA